ncbi:MAG TPA: hypothetical protein VEH07_08165 [Alphaproteobacteria bacterium]|nr:hypothetical protein [Alphaproteobacteria bacterium]
MFKAIGALIALGFGFALLSAPANAATSPFAGTWVLNVSKSTYSPGPGPKSQTIKIEDLGGGKFKSTNDITPATGAPTHSELSYAMDGKPYSIAPPPAAGSPAPDAVAFKSIDATSFEVTTMKGGKPIGTKTVVKLSANGKSLTATSSGTNAEGKPVNNVVLFEKQ